MREVMEEAGARESYRRVRGLLVWGLCGGVWGLVIFWHLEEELTDRRCLYGFVVAVGAKNGGAGVEVSKESMIESLGLY